MKTIKKLFIIFVLVFSLFVGSSTVNAKVKTIKIGYIDYDNFIVKSSNDTYEGYGVEYLNEIAKYTKWNYEYVYDTWDNILEGLLSGEIDFVCQAQKTPERELIYSFSKYSVGQESSILYVNSDNYNYYYDDITNFDGMKVAYLNKSFQKEAFIEYAAKNEFSFEGVDCENNQECFSLLDSNEVDAVAVGSLSLKSGYRAIAKFASDPFYFMCGKDEKNINLLDDVNDAIARIKANNPLFEGELYEKYYSMEVSSNDISYTREETSLINEKNTIDIALIPNRTPFSYVSDNNEIDGIIKDIMEVISEKSGLIFQYSMMPKGQGAISYLEENPDVLVSGVAAENLQFKNGYSLSKYFYKEDIVLASKYETKYNVNAEENTYKLGLSKSNASLVAYLEENHKEFELVFLDSNEECADYLVNNKIDFFASNTKIIQNLIQKPKYKDITILPTYFKEESMSICGIDNNRNNLIISIIDKTINSLLDDEIEQIVLNQTIKTRYTYSLSDIMYEYRIPLIIIIILIILLTISLIGIILFRNHSYKKLDIINSKLTYAVKEANKANETKSRFLAQISHEIRTPMNAIIGLTSLSQNGLDDKAKVNDYLSKIDSSSKLLLGIINDVLDMSAIEGGKLKIDVSEFDIKNVIENITSMFYQQAKLKGINFNCRIFSLLDEKMLGDELRLNQILLNLLSNALKFTKIGGNVDFNISEDSRKNDKIVIRFEVIDDGCGMSDDMKERLFLPFEQESAKTANRYGGSGLGLSISKNLIDLMEGQIEVDSQINKGTKFTVRIPFKKVKYENNIKKEEFKDIKAIIVDDDIDSCNYCARLLDRLNVKHDIVTDPEIVLEKMALEDEKKSPYNLCIIDYKMPKMSGDILASKIKDIFGANPVVVIISAYDLSEIEENGIVDGVDYFITKPLFQSTIYNALLKISNHKGIINNVVDKNYDFSGKRILVAEDVELNMEVITKLLEKVNVVVEKAYDGKAAIDKYMNSPDNYDLILLDINMPIINGYEVAKMIRVSKTTTASSVKIFAMTANAFSEDIKKAEESGMNGHIAKPIDVALLYQTLNEAFKGEDYE